MIKKIFLGSISKDTLDNGNYQFNIEKDFILDHESLNEDSWAISDDNLSIAISDGATESYDSKLWAKILCQKFVGKTFSSFDEYLISAEKDYAKQHDIHNMTWTQIEAYQRGSFATFIGVNYSQIKNSLKITCIGDSCIFLFKKSSKNYLKRKRSRVKKKTRVYRNCKNNHKYEYQKIFDIPDFKNCPQLISTKKNFNTFDFDKYTKYVNLSKYNDYYLFLCTDALADWLINSFNLLKSSTNLTNILNLQNNLSNLNEFFYTKVMEARKNKKMKIDDSTLIILKIN
ncbi:hypothetical protein A9G41_08630 [Gilliamella sp. Nev5-1]|nr:hypothetical protein [Gilliamella apicola]OCG68236.1 hypothetical protein A9G41_08630 [Gilliamella apicola]